MLGFNTQFIATVGTAMDTVERGGKPRHSLRAVVRMPKTKGSEEYGNQWVTLNIRDFNAEYARNITVGSRVVCMGTLRTAASEDGTKTYFDVDVQDITAFPKTEAVKAAVGGPDW